MHFWMEDAVRVNGFNEAFIGWGREDSEFVCRLLNAGIQRKNIALAAVAWHLYHPEASRKMLPENDAILEKCIKEGHRYAATGMWVSKDIRAKMPNNSTMAMPYRELEEGA
ncbi:MAG: hypothetical protein IPK46_05905 [Saprospiraceae bacterium]|nr:hypothetical protein [Saprospiraceae bacterium]